MLNILKSRQPDRFPLKRGCSRAPGVPTSQGSGSWGRARGEKPFGARGTEESNDIQQQKKKQKEATRTSRSGGHGAMQKGSGL